MLPLLNYLGLLLPGNPKQIGFGNYFPMKSCILGQIQVEEEKMFFNRSDDRFSFLLGT